MDKTHWIMDWETLSNCSVVCFEDYKKEDTLTFAICDLRNDFPALIQFLKRNIELEERHISFNGLNFDSQITEFILKNESILREMSGSDIGRAIYAQAQETIGRSNNGEFLEWYENKLSIKQLDLYRIHHWDNVNRRSSLKYIQYSMDWPNLLDMPIEHTKEIKTLEELDIIIEYCKNDVKSTKQILNLSKTQINLRNVIAKKYDIPCRSYSNTKIGSELLLKLYCQKTGRKDYEVRKYRTFRESIKMKDVLFPYLKFKSFDFQDFLKKLEPKIITNTKGDFKYHMTFMGSKFEYGSGGIHQCIDPGIYLSNDEFIIMDLDVASLYPSIAIVNEMYPAHLGREFYDVYKNDIVGVRLAEKAKGKDGDKAIIEGFKEAANASYGNSNSKFSWLYDPLYTMKTTINGQLLISMLVEELLLKLSPDTLLLQTNTDGATFRIKRSELDIYYEVCKNWEKMSRLILEYAEYNKMFIWDVNNYIAVYTNGKTKCKGRFEWEDQQNYKPSHLHKNKSHLIIPKAIFNYFVNDIPPEQFLMSNRNIYDYCAGVKTKGSWTFYTTCVVNGIVHQNKEQKTLRYYITGEQGCKLVKRENAPGTRRIQVEAGDTMVRLFNLYEDKPWADYEVNDDYYLDKIYEEISNIMPKKKQQLDLF
jgi:hypothetical protein